VSLRIWDAAATSIRGVTSGRFEEPVQELAEIKNLLELLSSMLETFEVAHIPFVGRLNEAERCL